MRGLAADQERLKEMSDLDQRVAVFGRREWGKVETALVEQIDAGIDRRLDCRVVFGHIDQGW